MKQLISITIVLLFAADALACSRCGLFGLRCRFSNHRSVKVLVPIVPNVPVNQISTVINIAPPQAYGPSEAYAQPVSLRSYQITQPLNETELAHIALEFGKLSANLFDKSQTGVQSLLANKLQFQAAYNAGVLNVESIRAASEHLLAAKGIQQTKPLNFSMRIENGKVIVTQNGQAVQSQRQGNLQIFNIQAKPPTPPNALNVPQELPSPVTGSTLQNKCVVCHSGANPKGGFSLEGSITNKQRQKAQLAMRLRAGEIDKDYIKLINPEFVDLVGMPPKEKPALTPQEILQIHGKLETIVK